MAYVLLREGGPYENFGYAHKEYMVDGAEDVQDIPKKGLAPGSNARTAGYVDIWDFGMDGQWVKVVKLNGT